MRDLSFFQRMRLRTRAHESAERWASHLRLPKASGASVEEMQRSFKVLRGVYEGAFLDAASDSASMEDGVRHLLARVHEALSPEEPEERVRNADRNLSEAYRSGYRAGLLVEV